MTSLSSVAGYLATTPRLSVSKTSTQSGASLTETLTLSGTGGNSATASATFKPTLSGAKVSATVTVNDLYTLNAVGQYNAATGTATASLSGSRGESARLAIDTVNKTLEIDGTTAQGDTYSLSAAGNNGAPTATLTLDGQSRSFGSAA